MEHKVSVVSDFDLEADDETVEQNSTFNDKKPIRVYYNSVDVTAQSKIELISGEVQINKPGVYELLYRVTFQGNSKTISRKVTVKEKSSSSPPTTENTNSRNN